MRLSCFILLSSASLPFALGAAEPQPQPSPRESTGVFISTAPNNITVDFRGGSLSQLAAAIANGGKGTFNIIGNAEDMSASVIPGFSVQNADPGAVMEALNALLLPHRIELTRPVRNNAGRTEAIEGTYTVHRRNPALRDPRPAFESFQLTQYLHDQSVDDIVGALRTAWELDPNHAADLLRLKYHPATSMLLVSGPEDAMRIVRDVLAKLRRTPPPPRPVPLPAPDRK